MSRKAKPRCPRCGLELRWMEAIDILTNQGVLRDSIRRRLIRKCLNADKQDRKALPRPWRAQEASPRGPLEPGLGVENNSAQRQPSSESGSASLR